MAKHELTLFLGGDTMTGRGIDQILPEPVDPTLYEPSVRDARAYVELAERASGRIARPVPFAYIWGDALAVLDEREPDARIVNLETSVTRSDERWPDKVVRYRMSPENARCLEAAHLDVCTLANNHTLDYGSHGLVETLGSLARARIKTAGAGRELEEARRPAVVELAGGGRVLVVACGIDAGIPDEWAAGAHRPGVFLLPDLSPASAAAVVDVGRALREAGDVVVASVHWGANWGFEASAAEVRFAHALVDGGVDVVFGHSSHHVRPVEIYRGKLVLYGAGELIDDYEGIGGYESFRGDLVLLYLPTLSRERGTLVDVRLVPMKIRRMRLERAAADDVAWLLGTLRRISARFETRFTRRADGDLEVTLP